MALPATAINAQANAESGNQDYTPSGQPVVSPVGAMYAMQVMPNTAADPGFGVTPAQNNSPEEYDRVGRDYINALTQHYGDYPTALAAYNWGPGNVDKYGAAAAPPETKGYVQKILSSVGNAIIPSAQAEEMPSPKTQATAPDPATMTESEIQAELNAQPTADANGGVPIPQGKSSLKWDEHGTPYRTDVQTPPHAPQPSTNAAIAPDPASMTEAEIQAELNDPSKTAMPANAAQSLQVGGLSGLAAHETAMGANAISQIPGLKETGSAIAAGLGAGQDDNSQGGGISGALQRFGQRYNNLENAQEAMRNAGANADPTATALAKIGGMTGGIGLGGELASGVAPESVAAFGNYAKAHPYLASMAAGGPMGAAYGFGNGTDFNSRLSNAATTGGLSALAAIPATAVLRNVVAPIAGKIADVGGSALGKIGDYLGNNLSNAPIASGAGEAVPSAVATEEPINETASEKAQDILQEALATDKIDPNNVADALEKAKATGLPVRAVDVMTKDVGGVPVGGRNAQGLLVATARMPGNGAQLAGEMAARSGALSDHVSGVLDDLVSKDGVYDVSDQALNDMATKAGPAYQKAFEGGSIAPLQNQLEDSFSSASKQSTEADKMLNDVGNRMTQVAAKKIQAQGNVYALSSVQEAEKAVNQDYEAALQLKQEAEANKAATLDMLRKSQNDASANAKGAVWNPRIQQFLNTPEVKAGIQRGLTIQRIEATAAGKPFNPTEYGITGTDEAGNPIIGNVPNMRLLDAGKKGLDAMINAEKNPLTGKMTEMGRALTQLKQSYVQQLDALNPDYAAAREIYGDAASRLSALRTGRNFLKMDPEEIERFANDPNTSAGDRAAFASGARRALSDRFKENPAAIGRQWEDVIRPRVASLASSPESLASADSKIEMIQRMTRNNNLASMAGNSITMPAQQFASKIEEAAASPVGKVAHAVIDPQSAAANAIKDLLDKNMQKRAGKMTADVAGEISRYLTSDDPMLWRNLGSGSQAAAQNAGQAVGVTSAGVAAKTAQ